ncbi:hypothetical protein [Patulibacter defluvii]|uniref:hypothetical protein n=1 Tax=Patulibacter defluvii TaxID=3095358 RepID=UPI002A75308E|nr:hypothetical protein [Patulibacter sp. DM4]
MWIPPSRLVPLLATAALTAGLAAPAAAEVRGGSSAVSTLQPRNPDLRIERTQIVYDTKGMLSGTVRTAGQLRDRNVFVTFVAGVYDRQRRCRQTTRDRFGVVGGAVDTFGFPPVRDPAGTLPPATRLASYDGVPLGGDGVAYAATGATARLVATLSPFAGRGWDCGWVDVADGATERTADRSPAFPLGRRATAENRRRQARALKRCGTVRQAGARKRCKRQARERYPA